MISDFERVTEDYLRSLASRKYSPATIESRSGSLRKLAAFMKLRKIKRVQDIGVGQVEDYRRWMRDCGLKENTLETHLYSLRHFFDYLEANVIMFENPARLVQFTNPRDPLPRVISVADVVRLLEAPDCSTPAGLRDRAMLEVLYSTGMRRAELLHLRAKDFDFNFLTVRVVGKGSRDRTVPVGRYAAEFVKRYLNESRPLFINPDGPESDALWLNSYKQPYSNQMVCRMVRHYAIKAGLPDFVTTHTLRRCCATHMLNAGAHPTAVSELLGHSRLATLSRYLRITITELKATHHHSKLGE